MADITKIQPIGDSTQYTLGARYLTHTPENTTTFLRGDNTWSNELSGPIQSSYKSGSWVNSLTNSAFVVPDKEGSYGGWICGPTKNGRIVISTYQNSNDTLYIGYGERGRTENSLVRQMTWNGADGTLTSTNVVASSYCTVGTSLQTGYKFYVNGTAKHTDRLYQTNWIEFTDNSGLYLPNSGSGTHFYPANSPTYGSFSMQGTKNSYHGITMGPDNNYMTVMSSGQHNGLYHASKGVWSFYYDRENNRCAIMSSSNSGYTCQMNGTFNCTNTMYGQIGLWVKGATAGNNAYVGSGGAIEMREINAVTTSQSDFSYAPKLGFHWGGRYQGTLALHSNGQFYLSLSAGAGNGTLRAGAVYGAVWNDYAEMRNIPEVQKNFKEEIQEKPYEKPKRNIPMAGYCVREVGDDTMELSTARLQRGCKIISDTFGFNIGETEDCKTPVAVSGRVLAYCYEGREEARKHIGYGVCSGPDGMISIMTEEEERMYPMQCIGTISSVPDYEVWGEENISVNGRIWIYVK